MEMDQNLKSFRLLLHLIITKHLWLGRSVNTSVLNVIIGLESGSRSKLCYFLLPFAVLMCKLVSVAPALSDGCIQDSFVCKTGLHLAAQTDETQAGTLLRVLELIYLWLAQCQFYIEVNERRKLHLPLCSLPWGGSLCLSQSTAEYSDKFHSINLTGGVYSTYIC